MLRPEDNVVGKKDRHRIALPAPQHRVPDSQRFWLDHDLDGERQLIVSQKLADLELGGRYNNYSGFKVGSRGLIQSMSDHRGASQRQEFFRNAQVHSGETGPQSGSRDHNPHFRRSMIDVRSVAGPCAFAAPAVERPNSVLNLNTEVIAVGSVEYALKTSQRVVEPARPLTREGRSASPSSGGTAGSWP